MTTVQDVVVETSGGRVRGFLDAQHGARVFLGIPYGSSPAGKNRFRPAAPATPWSGVLDTLV